MNIIPKQTLIELPGASSFDFISLTDPSCTYFNCLTIPVFLHQMKPPQTGSSLEHMLSLFCQCSIDSQGTCIL